MEQATLDLPHSIDNPDTWSARFVIAADGAEQRGLAFPWYMHRRNPIHDWHGGRAAVVELIADLALGLMNENPDLTVEEATLEAGNEFRQSIRSQWDYNSGGPTRFDNHIEWMEMQASENVTGNATLSRSIAEHRAGAWERHPADIEDPERERITLLRQALRELTPLQRQAAELRSGGMTYRAIADELGMAAREQAYGACKRAFKNIKDYITERETA